MTSNILGITPNLEAYLEEFYHLKNTYSRKQLTWEDTERLHKEFTDKHPLFMKLYLLDDQNIVDHSANTTNKKIVLTPGTHSTGLYATKPGSDDFHGNWNVRGNQAFIGEKKLGEVAYAHSSNKPISDLIDNNNRQQKVAWKTLQNQQTYLHNKIMAYDPKKLTPNDIDERAIAIRSFMRPISDTYKEKFREIGIARKPFWNTD